MNFIKNELFKQIEKFKTIRDYIINTKENFLSEEFYKAELEAINKKIEKLYEEIKMYR